MAETDAEKRIRTLQRQLEKQVQLSKKRSEQLRALADELLQAEQAERQRIAEHLHDNLQQLLMLTKMQLEKLLESTDGATHVSLQESCGSLQRAIRASRDLATELNPPVLQEAGLAAALEWVAREFESSYELKVQLALRRAEPASEGLRVFLYRAVHELLFNVVKHAGVNECQLTMRPVEGDVEIVVADRGKGIDADARIEQRGNASGMGLHHIAERLDIRGGSMRIDAQRETGCRIVLRAPRRSAVHEPLDEEVQLEDGARLVVDVESGTKALYGPDVPEHIRVLIADDHQMFSQGLVSLLADLPDIEVVGQAANGRLAVELAASLHPQVVIMDYEMPLVGGLEATREILRTIPQTRILMLSMHDEENLERAATQAGVAAFLTKEDHSTKLVDTIRRIMGVRTGD
jgi:CheY-like chemotaxis protein/two-component sensor histidine kinase